MENVKLSPAQKFWKTVKSNPIVVLLVVIGIIVGFTKDNFFSWRNFGNLASNTAVRFLIALGVSGCLITKGTDLSAGRQVGFAACLAGVLLQRANYAGRLFPNMPEMNMGVVLLIVLAIGAVFGLLNGLIIAFLNVPPFIATLGTMFCARGVAYLANGNRNTDAIVTGLGKEAGDAFQNFFYYGKTLGIYNAFWIAFVIFAVVFFLMNKTRTGRHIYAIGSNVDAAKLSGINVFATTTKAYLISAFCAAIVGLILAGQAGMGNMEAGNSYEMYGVAAGVIGGISPLGGSGLLLGAFAGAGVWQTLENGLGIIGAPVGIQRIVIGVIVTGAVLIDVVFRQGTKKVKK